MPLVNHRTVTLTQRLNREGERLGRRSLAGRSQLMNPSWDRMLQLDFGRLATGLGQRSERFLVELSVQER